MELAVQPRQNRVWLTNKMDGEDVRFNTVPSCINIHAIGDQITANIGKQENETTKFSTFRNLYSITD